jgi:serine phosphatase RsbU (regulator of sigma subunit)
MNTAAEFVTGDTTQLSALAGRQSIVLNELRTLIAIPLRTRREPRTVEADGVLYLDSRSVSRNLSGVSHDVLRALASECAAALESARLIEAEQAARQYRQEMEIAASIQHSLIGESEVQCEFAKAKGHSVSCKEVGGDFFDVSILAGIITVVVVDVSGKGISAALLASVIRGMFHAQISNGTRLVDAVDAVNKFLCSRVGGLKYATLAAAQLRDDGVLHVVNCGHVPPVIFAGDVASLVEEGDLPVGLMAQASFHVIEREFPVRARLCIVTDGISESEGPQGAEFGLDRLQQYLGGNDPINDILASVQEFSGHMEAQDDRTLVVLERTK